MYFDTSAWIILFEFTSASLFLNFAVYINDPEEEWFALINLIIGMSIELTLLVGQAISVSGYSMYMFPKKEMCLRDSASSHHKWQKHMWKKKLHEQQW